MVKIRCKCCGHVIAYQNAPITGGGEISIMCNNRKSDKQKCKTINIIKRKENTEN